MSTTAIVIEHLWKEYRLGVIGHGTLTHDLQSWWAKVRNQEDPNALVVKQTRGKASQIDGKRFWALRDINLEISKGEILGIIGKNGAGKSTLLKILSRVTAPSQGCIKVKGRIASLLEVGTGFHPELTGRENIFLNGAILGMTKPEVRAKLDEIVEFSGVSQHIDTPVKRYSSGMHVRLAFAVAAHLEPEILVVDEVLAVGDAEFQRKCIGKMGEVASGGRTVLFVSHNMGAVQNLCTRLVVLKEGLVEFDGETKSGIQHYLTGTRELAESAMEERGDRSGTGDVKTINYWFEYPNGDACSVLYSGQSIVMVIEYVAKKEGLKGDVEIKIRSVEGVIMTSLSNVYCGSGNLEFKSKGTIRCTIEKLPLPKGNYYFDLLVRAENRQVLENYENVGMLEVGAGNFHAKGKDHRDSRWGLLVDHYLEVN